jgi:hypothetical protein
MRNCAVCDRSPAAILLGVAQELLILIGAQEQQFPNRVATIAQERNLLPDLSELLSRRCAIPALDCLNRREFEGTCIREPNCQ